MIVAGIQDWLADRGYGQYSRPRWQRRGRSTADQWIFRLAAGAFGLMGTVIFGVMLVIELVVIYALIHGAIFG